MGVFKDLMRKPFILSFSYLSCSGGEDRGASPALCLQRALEGVSNSGRAGEAGCKALRLLMKACPSGLAVDPCRIRRGAVGYLLGESGQAREGAT